MRTRRSQEGVVLLVGLLMLVMLTLMAVGAINLGRANFAVVANEQSRSEATRAADLVLDQVIDNANIEMTAGANLFGTGANVIDIDINGDGGEDYTVTVATPRCAKAAAIKQAALNFSKADDLGCVRSIDQSSLGVEGSASGDSICSEVVWDAVATARDAFQITTVTITQGVGQRVATNKVALTCN